jgi:hypothetical protein
MDPQYFDIDDLKVTAEELAAQLRDDGKELDFEYRLENGLLTPEEQEDLNISQLIAELASVNNRLQELFCPYGGEVAEQMDELNAIVCKICRTHS